MAQVSYGTITVSDLTDITDVFLQYAKAVDSVTITNDYVFSQTGEVGWYTLTLDTSIVADKYYFELINNEYKIVSNPTGNPATYGWYESSVYPTWTSGYQIWIRQVTIKDGVDVPDYGTPYLDTAVNQINNTFDTKLKYFWINQINSQTYPAGTYTASGINGVPFDTEDSSTYGYNTHYGNGISLRYNAVNMATLNGSALTFYQPPTISENTVTPGNKAMVLSGNALAFYKPNDEVTAAATLNSTGLNISDGTIDLTSSETDRVHLSTRNLSNATTINGESTVNWRLILGNKFGVTKEGYMSAASGKIGGWSINSTSLYSLGKTEWDEDTNGIFIGNHDEENYFLTEDTTVVSGKTYYSYNKQTEKFIEVSNPAENPKTEEYYEKETQSIFTISGGKIQYVKTDDITVNRNSDYYTYDEITGTYTKIVAPSENLNPSTEGWYKSLGPMWYINSDGSASFGSLLVNQSGSLDVPAASISGKLTADQIEVNNLGAISANIGSTINSETTSNSFEVNSEKKVIDTTDTEIIAKKEYDEINNDIPLKEIVEESFINLKTQKSIYKLTTDSSRLLGKEYYEFNPDYSLTNDESIIENTRYYTQEIDGSGNISYSLVNGPSNPKENNYYELHPKYEVNNDIGNPSNSNLYEIESTYSAGITLQEGSVSILSNEEIVAKTGETNSTLDLYNTELIGHIDIGNLRIMSYDNGLVVTIGD